jgi:DNA-binding transcriptional regulator/RsmH inhibitor MraZ
MITASLWLMILCSDRHCNQYRSSIAAIQVTEAQCRAFVTLIAADRIASTDQQGRIWVSNRVICVAPDGAVLDSRDMQATSK